MRFFSGSIDELVTRIFYGCNPIKYYFNVFKGITTGLDKIYVLNKEQIEKERYNNEERKYFKPWFKNSDIKQYFAKNKTNKFVIYLTKFDNQLKQHPKIWNYLKNHEEQIKSRRDANLRGNFKRGYWWVLATPRLEIPFDKPKIVVPQRSHTNCFGYTENEWFGSGDIYYITTLDKTVSLKYALALLNSKLYYVWLYKKGK